MPIPAFYCDDCGKYVITPETIGKVKEDVYKRQLQALSVGKSAFYFFILRIQKEAAMGYKKWTALFLSLALRCV